MTAGTTIRLFGQDPIRDQQIENLSEKTDTDNEDDADQQRLNEWHRNPINLNKISEEELISLGVLTPLQIKQFFAYRQLLGKLISVYELQAVPGWNIETIRKVLPYIIIKDDESLVDAFQKRWRAGNNYFLLRVSQVFEKAKGFQKPTDSSGSYFLGSPQRIFCRYTYNYKNSLQYGILGEKDAGEQFFKGYQQYGFDFYSFHFFMKEVGLIKFLAIGDFTVNMGQGLIQWQGLAFTKSAMVLSVNRQSPILRPYHSSGEFNYHRGMGITIMKNRWEATAFVSSKKISTNIGWDTVTRGETISSFENSGYHRTKSEGDDRNNVRQFAVGSNISFSADRFHVGVNAVAYHFSKAIQKKDEPYNLYAIAGKSWADFSTDYHYVYQNFYLFGEVAVDKNFNHALVQGLMASLSRSADVSLLYRNIGPRFQSLNADAFSENSVVNNEKGLYMGLSVRPLPAWQIDAFADVYNFPWLKFRIDAPSNGTDLFAKVTYTPSKKWYIYTYLKSGFKTENDSGDDFAIRGLVPTQKQNWRVELSLDVNNKFSIKTRVDGVRYHIYMSSTERGFLGLFNLTYRASKNGGADFNFEYFETSGYRSRLYAAEQDVLYSYSAPPMYGKGIRYYIRLNTKLNRLIGTGKNFKPQMDAWIRWAQTVYPAKISTGSGADQIDNKKRTELKIQLILRWQKS